MSTLSLSMKNVSKGFKLSNASKPLLVLNNVSLQAKKGEFVGILGPNGCGKTTLLRMIAGIEKPDNGLISVFGKKPEDSRIGYVAQHSDGPLFPWFSALDNLAFVKKSRNNESSTRALNALQNFGIAHYANAFPYQLSGGIKQLVSIARAAFFEPDVFLLDEPFNALDYQNRFLVENALLKLREADATAFMVSHDIESIVLLCDKIIVLSEKPSNIRMLFPVNLLKKRNSEMKFLPEFASISKQVFNALRETENETIAVKAHS